MARLLIVEDDDGIRVPLVRALRREGYAVEACADGDEGLAAVRRAGPEVTILDLGLPGLDGLDLCRLIRGERPAARIIVLTARDGEADVIDGLDAGADDYVTKPFGVGELLARVRAQLRRASDQAPAEAVSDVRVDPGARRAWHAGAELELSLKEFDLLALLVANSGRVVTRERIMAAVWDENWFGSTKTLDMHVSWLRRKLGDDAADPRHLTTVRGVGLRFDA